MAQLESIGKADSRVRCAVCRRPVALRRDGAIRVHGALGTAVLDQESRHARTVIQDPGTACHPPSQVSATPTPQAVTAGITRPQRVPILKRLPQAFSDPAARELETILEQVTVANDVATWMRLMNFSNRCLRVPKRGGRRWNLTRFVNQQLAEESDPPPPSGQQRSAPHSTTQHQDDPDTLQAGVARVSAKLEEGDMGVWFVWPVQRMLLQKQPMLPLLP